MNKLEKVKELISLFESIKPFEFYYDQVYIVTVYREELSYSKRYSFDLSNGSKIVIKLNKSDIVNG